MSAYWPPLIGGMKPLIITNDRRNCIQVAHLVQISIS